MIPPDGQGRSRVFPHRLWRPASWFRRGLAGLVVRVLQLWMQDGLMTGLVWATKIITDPFHDIWLYHKAPLHLLKGELIDPMTLAQRH